MSKKMEDDLGKEATDKVTGYKGIVTGYCGYLTGCNQYLVTPSKSEDGKYPSGTWLDTNRLNLSEDIKVVIKTKEEPDGPDIPAPIK